MIPGDTITNQNTLDHLLSQLNTIIENQQIIKENQQIIKTALANPLDRFQMGIRKLIEELMIERMGENDKIVTRYMSDRDFQA